MQTSALPATSTRYNLPTTIINPYKEKSKAKQFMKQIHKRNITGEGGTSPTPTEAHAMMRSAHKTLRSKTKDLPLGIESRRQDQP
jgi:ribosomal protein S10